MATKKKTQKHREAADEHAATELVMFIENTSDLSPDGPHGQGHSVLLNALRKWKKGTYDPELAVRLFEYLAESGAKRYQTEFGSDAPIFNPATRHEAAKQLEASFRSSVENGEYEHVDTRVGGPREAHESHGESFTPKLSGEHVGRRVEITRVAWKSPNSYFKPGQFGYVVGQDQRGGCSLVDADRTSEPGETALLISKTRDMRGGALWFSTEGVRFTGRGAHEAEEEYEHVDTRIGGPREVAAGTHGMRRWRHPPPGVDVSDDIPCREAAAMVSYLPYLDTPYDVQRGSVGTVEICFATTERAKLFFDTAVASGHIERAELRAHKKGAPRGVLIDNFEDTSGGVSEGSMMGAYRHPPTKNYRQGQKGARRKRDDARRRARRN